MNLPEKIVGNYYQVLPIKSKIVRLRNQLKKSENRQPIVSRVKTKDGQTYKLLDSQGCNCNEISRMSDNRDKIEKLKIAPDIVYKTNKFLLVNYIHGKFPDISNEIFMQDLGRVFAELHKLHAKERDTLELKNQVNKNIDYLYNNKIIGKSNANDLSRFLDASLPKKMMFGMTYTDHNISNFVYDKYKKLWLIDLGSFQDNIPLDMYLGIGNLRNVINNKIFKKTYINSGGFEQIFEHHELFEIISNIKSAVQCAKILKSSWWRGPLGWLVPIVDFRLISARKGCVRNAINNLNNAGVDNG